MKSIITACFYTPTLDTDSETFGLACTRHRCFYPCKYPGQPPFEGPPVHVDQIPSKDAAVEFARVRTGGVRDIVVHTNFRTKTRHITGASRDCWCNPEVTR